MQTTALFKAARQFSLSSVGKSVRWRRIMPLFFSLGWLLAAPAALPQNTYDLDDLEKGQVLLNLSINEEREVQQDRLSAVLQFSTRGQDRTALQNEVNQNMSQALEALAGREELEYHTQQYHVHALYNNRNNRDAQENPTWQAQQSLRLYSQDSDAVLDAVATLQAMGLHVQQLGYSLSPETQREVTDSLLEAAINSLQRKAEHTASLLGKQRAEIIELNLSDTPNYGFARSAMSTMAMDSAEMAPPVAEPGRSTVSLSLSARVLISP